jgi:hypothetical protein
MNRPTQSDTHQPTAPSPLSIIGGGFLATTALRATPPAAPADQPDRPAAETGHTSRAQGDDG